MYDKILQQKQINKTENMIKNYRSVTCVPNSELQPFTTNCKRLYLEIHTLNDSRTNSSVCNIVMAQQITLQNSLCYEALNHIGSMNFKVKCLKIIINHNQPNVRDK